jgi:hypothetical protein
MSGKNLVVCTLPSIFGPTVMADGAQAKTAGFVLIYLVVHNQLWFGVRFNS